MSLALAPGVPYHCSNECMASNLTQILHATCPPGSYVSLLLQRQIRHLIMLASKIRFGMIQLILCLSTLPDQFAILLLCFFTLLDQFAILQLNSFISQLNDT